MLIFRRLLTFLRPYRRDVVWSFVLAFGSMGATVLIPYLTGVAIDSIRGHRSTRPDHVGDRDRRRGCRKARAQRRSPRCRRSRLARRRARSAQQALRTTAAPRALVLRSPADGPADVASDGRPSIGAVLPRLRTDLHRAVPTDDRAGRGRDVRAAAAARRACARARPVRSRGRAALRPALTPGTAGGSAADRRAHRRR